MQIFFKSHSRFSSSRGFTTTSEQQSESSLSVFANAGVAKPEERMPLAIRSSGFTLVELLIVTAITAIISTIIVVRFSGFDSTVLLKSLAYEIAVGLRETQVFSLSALGTGTGGNAFRTPYGMSFTPDSREYTFFQYTGSPNDPTKIPNRSTPGDYSDVNTFLIGRSLQVYEVCVTGSGPEDCTISRLDISFRRPEFDAKFFAVDSSGNDWSRPKNIGVSSARIKVISGSDPTSVWYIEVSALGQITVDNE